RGINVGTLVGHSGIRRYVMGEASGERVKATPEELAQMQKLVHEAMYDGALGFSTAPKDRGDPAGVPDDAERWALASVLGELGTGVFQVAGGAPGGTKQTRAVARELAARTGRRGRARGLFNRRWDLIEVFMTTKGQNRHLEGKTIEQIAKEQNKSIMDAFLDLSLDEDLQTCFQAIDRNHDPKVQKHILGSQYTVIGTSDGGGRPHTADRHETSTHLLGHWVREQQAMPLEEAVYRLTGKTALMHDITE